eukprot:10132869-Heterocapsa_arctica.AAC.1
MGKVFQKTTWRSCRKWEAMQPAVAGWPSSEGTSTWPSAPWALLDSPPNWEPRSSIHPMCWAHAGPVMATPSSTSS